MYYDMDESQNNYSDRNNPGIKECTPVCLASFM